MSLILTESCEAARNWDGGNPTLELIQPGKWVKILGSMVHTSSATRHGTLGMSNNTSTPEAKYNHQVQSTQEHATFIYGHARRYNATVTNQQYHVLARFLSDSGATIHVTVYWDSTNNRILIHRGDGIFGIGTQIFAGSNGSYVMDQNFHYYEIKCTLDDTAGAVEVKVDGLTTIATVTGVDTKNGGTKTVLDTIQLTSMDFQDHLDDIYLCNGAGTVNNDYLGDVIIEYLTPNNNGSSSQAVGSDGNQVDNYQMILQRRQNDPQYVELINTSDADSYNFVDSAYAAPNAPAGVIVYVRAEKTDAGPRHFQITAKEGGSTQASSDKTPSWNSYSMFQHVFETRPDGSPWGFTDVNSTEFGVTNTA